MKRIFRRNQIIITTLAVMIAAAGYLNYSSKKEVAGAEVYEAGMMDISDSDILAENQAKSGVDDGSLTEIASLDGDGEEEALAFFENHQKIRRFKTLHMILLNAFHKCHFDLIEEIIYYIIIVNDIMCDFQILCYISLCATDNHHHCLIGHFLNQGEFCDIRYISQLK